MAVLPTYSPQETISTGTDTLRLAHKDDGGGHALANLGAQISSYGLATARADYAEAAADSAEQKRIDGLSDSLVRQDMASTWAEKQVALEENIDPTGKDYRKTVDAAWKEHVSGYQDKWSGYRKAENEILTARMGAQVNAHAIGLESKTRQTSQMAVFNKVVEDAKVTVSANPDSFAAVLEDAQLKADTLGFVGKFREPFMREVRRSAEAGRAQWFVKNNPQAALDASQGAVAGFAKTDVPPEQAKVIGAAKATNMDPALLLGIAKIESGFNPGAVSRNGFKGVFQTKSEGAYGAHDEKDTAAQGLAVGTFLAKRQQEMRDRDVEPTPGRTFMFHNVGEGVAWKLIYERDPNKPMGQLLYETYGDSKFKSGELKREAVGRANPDFYNPNMTVGQVRDRYETNLRGAMTATSSYISDGGAPDDVARVALSKMLGIDVQQLGAADLANIADQAAKSLGGMKKADIKAQLGMAIVSGGLRMQPYNKEHQSAVNDFVKDNLPGVADQLVLSGTDDQSKAVNGAAFAAVTSFVQEHNYLPQQWNGAMRELVMNGDAKNPAKARAYAALASIEKDNPTAYEAAGFDADMKKRVTAYQRIVENTGDAAQALKFISTEFGTNAKEHVKALKSVVDHESKQNPGEVQQLKFEDITDAFKKGDPAKGEPGSWRAPFDPTNSSQKALMMQSYRETYKDYRYGDEALTPAAAKQLAIAAVTKSWGTSSAFTGFTDAPRFMQNPPDRFYAQPVVGMKPFEDQAREVVQQEIARIYPTEVAVNLRQKGTDNVLQRPRGPYATSKYDVSKLEVYILPSTQDGARTNDQVRSGVSAPAYQVLYRDPRDGTVQIANPAWQPNLDRMRDEAAEAQNSQKLAATKKRTSVDNATRGLVSGSGYSAP